MPKFSRKKINQIPQDKTKLWKMAAIISIVLFLAVASLAVNYFMFKGGRGKKIVEKTITTIKTSQEEPKEEGGIKIDRRPVNERCEGCIRRNIDGIYVEEKFFNLPLVAIMIDNHFDARPPYGLNRAKLVYEAEVEGNFTRYMAVFDSGEEIPKIGPVRSARPYFVDWARELGAIYAHCGGSPEALVQIIQKNILDLNEFYNGQYFWRSKERSAPYNILTSMDDINKFLKKEKQEEAQFMPWGFKDDATTTRRIHPEIKINFNHPDFKVAWKHNRVDNNYIRYQAGRLNLTAGNNIISAKNIIIQEIPAQIIDGKLRLEIDTVGQGKAIICQDGLCRQGKWKKTSSRARTRYYYEDESEVLFNAGPTWIEIVRPGVEVVY